MTDEKPARARWGIDDYDFNTTGVGGPLEHREYDLPGIQRSTMTLKGFAVRKPPLKVGDRVTIVLGRRKIYERIVTKITHWDPLEPWDIGYTSRPATPEDGPRNKKLIRKMRMSQRKRGVRHWFRWVPGVGNDG